MCKFFEVSRSGYYDFVKRIGKPEQDTELADEIRICQHSTDNTYGYRRVWLWLDHRKIHRNPKTVLRVMKKYGLLSEIRRRRKWVNLGQQIRKYDNSIVAYKTASHQTVSLVLDTIRLAMKKEKKIVAAELQLHSGQGFQYTSPGYFNLTQSYGITPSMSSKGNPYDNAMAENFFSILKTECIYRHKPKTFQEADNLIDRYIYFYTMSAFKQKQEWRR